MLGWHPTPPFNFLSGKIMIIDHRTYDFHPGKMKAWIDVYEEYALPLQNKYLGNFIGFFTTEVGPINQVTFMWGFQDAGDRERRRAEMEADPGWAEFARRSSELGALKQQTDKLIRPVSFSPIQ